MYTEHFLTLLIRRSKFARLVGSLAFEFDANSGKFVLIKSRSRVIAMQVQYIMTLIYVAFLFYRLGNLPMLKMLQGFPFLFLFVLMLSVGSHVSVDVAPVQIINAIVGFEKDLLQGMPILDSNLFRNAAEATFVFTSNYKIALQILCCTCSTCSHSRVNLNLDNKKLDGDSIKTSLEARMMLVYLYNAEFSCIIMPFGVLALLITDPCTPPFLLSSFKCSEIFWTFQGPEIYVVFFEAWMAVQTCGARNVLKFAHLTKCRTKC